MRNEEYAALRSGVVVSKEKLSECRRPKPLPDVSVLKTFARKQSRASML